MPDLPPPGQLADEGYWRSANPSVQGYPWATMAPGEQAHWDAAAPAASAAWWQQHEALLCGDKEDDDA